MVVGPESRAVVRERDAGERQRADVFDRRIPRDARDLATAVIAALGSPDGSLEAKSALALADKCWASLQGEIVAEVARETPDSYYVHNSCLILMKYNAVTGPRAARCRALVK